MTQEGQPWSERNGKRPAPNEMIFDNGKTQVRVEIHHETPEIHDLATLDLESHMKLTGYVAKDDGSGIDPNKAYLFEGYKMQGPAREPADDSILGKLKARLHSRFPSMHVSVAIPEKTMGNPVLGLQREHGVYEYHVMLEIPKGRYGTDVSMSNAIRQELQYIKEEYDRIRGGHEVA